LKKTGKRLIAWILKFIWCYPKYHKDSFTTLTNFEIPVLQY